MPTILTPQGWVKVAAPPAARRRTVAIDPVEALKGPLAYFSCRPQPKAVMPGTLVRASGGRRAQEAYPYDLDASPEILRAQNRARSNNPQIRIGGKNRTVSAPVLAPETEYDPLDPEEEMEYHRERHRHSSRGASSKRHVSHTHASGRYDDGSSLSSGSTGSSASLASSTHSHHRHRPRPVDPTPTPVHTAHSSHRAPAPQQPHRRSGYYDNYTRPPPQPAPPSSASGRSMSYNWFNATTPLNI